MKRPSAAIAGALVVVAIAAAPASAKTIQGERNADGGCSFTGKIALAPGQAAVTQKETGFDPLTCTLQVKTSVAKAAAGSQAAAAAVQSRGYLITRYINQNGFIQNQIRNQLTWNHNGARVTGGQCLWNYQQLNFWRRYGVSTLCRLENGGRVAHSRSIANWESFRYCPSGGRTWTLQQNNVWGYANGFLEGTWFVNKGGACAASLRFQRVLRRVF